MLRVGQATKDRGFDVLTGKFPFVSYRNASRSGKANRLPACCTLAERGHKRSWAGMNCFLFGGKVADLNENPWIGANWSTVAPVAPMILRIRPLRGFITDCARCRRYGACPGDGVSLSMSCADCARVRRIRPENKSKDLPHRSARVVHEPRKAESGRNAAKIVCAPWSVVSPGSCCRARSCALPCGCCCATPLARIWAGRDT